MTEVMIVTCEHAGNDIPSEYEALFGDQKDILESHRGWDPGALEIATVISSFYRVPFYYTTISRLVVEANRSLTNSALFSEFTNHLPSATKAEISEKYWQPYRQRVEQSIRTEIEAGNRVLHLSIHTFTPVWNGVTREVELGILYDPDRKTELGWAHSFSSRVSVLEPALVVRHNEPYLGTDDGFTTYLRTRFSSENYLGIELEINQKFVNNDLDRMNQLLAKALQSRQ